MHTISQQQNNIYMKGLRMKRRWLTLALALSILPACGKTKPAATDDKHKKGDDHDHKPGHDHKDGHDHKEGDGDEHDKGK
ncbi:MAG: hypothetical protein RJA70_1965 [Pseudomonadota bacterium]